MKFPLWTVLLVLHAHNCFCKPADDHEPSYEVGNHRNVYRDHDSYPRKHGYGGYREASLDSIKPHSYDGRSYKSYENEYHGSYNPRSRGGHFRRDGRSSIHSYQRYNDNSYGSKPHTEHIRNRDHSSSRFHNGPHSYNHIHSRYNHIHSRHSKRSLPPGISNALGDIVDASRNTVMGFANAANRKIFATHAILKEVSREIQELEAKTLAAIGAKISGIKHQFVDTGAAITDRSLVFVDDVITELTQESAIGVPLIPDAAADKGGIRNDMSEQDMIEEVDEEEDLGEAEKDMGEAEEDMGEAEEDMGEAEAMGEAENLGEAEEVGEAEEDIVEVEE